MDKFGKTDKPWLWAIGIVVAAYLFYPPFQTGVQNFLSGIGGGAAPATPVVGGIDCIHDGATMTLGPVEVRYSPATSLVATGIRDRVIINGKDRGMQKDGATMDVNYKDNVVIYYNFNDTTTKNAYYGAKQELTVPCTSSFSSADESVDGAAYQIIAIGAPTFTVFNEDDGLQNTITHPENLTANDAATFRIKMTQAAETGYSSYGNIILCAKYNNSIKDKITLSIENGAGLTEVSTPDVVSQHNSPNTVRLDLGATSGSAIQCWEDAGIDTEVTLNKYYALYFKTGSTTVIKPQTNITFSVWDEDFYRNTDTGAIEFGPANDQDSDRGLQYAGNVSIMYTG